MVSIVCSGDHVSSRGFGLDLFVAADKPVRLRELLEFFQRLSPRWINEFGLPVGSKKGIVKVVT